MILWLWWKKKGWRWWMRFKKPIAHFSDTGCMNNAHNSVDEGCPCNGGYAARRHWERKGYKLVAWRCEGGIWSDGKNIVTNSHSYGR
jgi:hypothetical protein